MTLCADLILKDSDSDGFSGTKNVVYGGLSDKVKTKRCIKKKRKNFS